MRGRRGQTYRAERVAPLRWELSVDGVGHSEHRSYRAAVQAARDVERRWRTRRSVVRSGVVLALSAVALGLVVGFRHTPNPDYRPARSFVERMESAYRSVDDGSVALGGLTVEENGFRGAAFTLGVGTVGETLVRVIAGEFGEDCYLIRWDSGDPPFVAVLAPRLPCEPGENALSSTVSSFERIGVQLFAERPIDWDPILPDATSLVVWFYPAVFVLSFVVLRTLVSLSIVAIQRGVAAPQVPVERIEPGDHQQSDSMSG